MGAYLTNFYTKFNLSEELFIFAQLPSAPAKSIAIALAEKSSEKARSAEGWRFAIALQR